MSLPFAEPQVKKKTIFESLKAAQGQVTTTEAKLLDLFEMEKESSLSSNSLVSSISVSFGSTSRQKRDKMAF